MGTSKASTTEGASGSTVWRAIGRVVVGFVAFDVVGVVLTVIAEVAAALSIVWETSTLLGYAVWFVTGVFCAIWIYPGGDGNAPDSPAGRRKGLQLVFITPVVAVLLGVLSSFVWSASGTGEAVAPDHAGVTITYLTTVVLVVAWARFVLFRGRTPAEPGLADLVSEQQSAAPVAALPCIPVRPEPHDDDSIDFKPAGFWKTLAFLLGVPALLFLDTSFFLLGPFDIFDPWTDSLLTVSLVGGLAWGFSAARWREPRRSLLVLHVPLLVGVIFYVFALLVGGLLVAFGVPERVSEIVTYVGFGLGLLVGCGAIVGWLAELFERSTPDTTPVAPAPDPRHPTSGGVHASDDDPAQRLEYEREIEHLARTRNIPPSRRVE